MLKKIWWGKRGVNFLIEDRAAHIDIADLLIRWMQERKDDLPEDVSEPLPDTPASENPVFLEVKKYISPEFHADVLALIEELGLELVGVTGIGHRFENGLAE